ncbi:MAG: hypothetical protein NZ840_04885 [Anaerolineales bacterium]|nr:hypothetical protein [Anaerolineales bacterium]MDW8161371.1 hypothetical protein [Anaerolineales bacterium]
MKQRLFSLQTTLWLPLAIAALIRFSALGRAPLTDSEAELALQAWQIAQGEPTVIQTYPLEVLVSSALFFLFGSSNFWARFLAAASGTLLILIVTSLHQRLGTPLTLVLAFIVAIDPALVAQSRQMGSVMPALAALGAVLLFASQARWGWVGIALGFGILSGPPFWFGSLLLLLVAIAFSAMEKRLASLSDSSQALWEQLLPAKDAFRTIGGATLLTLLFSSTLFLFYLRGLGAILAPLLSFLAGWAQTSSVSIPHLLLALGVYQPLAILFGGVSIVRSLLKHPLHPPSLSQRWQRLLALWLGVALLLAIVYPGRQMGNLVWAILPLWILAAQEITRWVETLEQPWWATLILGGVTFVLLALFWLQLAAYSSLAAYGIADWLRFAGVFSSLALIALSVWLAEMVWSPRLAWQGMILGALVAFALYTVSAVWGVAFSLPWSQVFRQELWKPYPQIGDADLILKTVHDLSRRKTGRADSLPILIAVDSPALRWLLRHQTQLTVLPEDQALARLSAWSVGEPPPLLITPATIENPPLSAAYRGQDFNWEYQPNWQGLPPFPLNWWLFRHGTWEIRPIILWARVDLFPDGQEVQTGQKELPLDTPPEKESLLDQP